MEAAGHGRQVDGIRLAAACWLALAFLPGSLVSRPISTRGSTVLGSVAARGVGSHQAMVVSLEAPGLAIPPPSALAAMDQKGFEFVPHLLAVVRGTTVRF